MCELVVRKGICKLVVICVLGVRFGVVPRVIIYEWCVMGFVRRVIWLFRVGKLCRDEALQLILVFDEQSQLSDFLPLISVD